MDAVPQTRYARSGDAHIAYQVFGSGSVDLVVFGALASHVELIWDDPSAARFLNRLSRFSRVIMFDGPARAIRCGKAIHSRMEEQGLSVRIGLHTGEVELRGDDDVGGIAVHIASRVAATAGPDEILVSQSIPPLVVGSGLEFTSAGRHSLKGVPAEWELFYAET